MNESRTDDKIALITGGNRGIGYEVCRQLGGLGMQVILTARDRLQGTRAAEALRAEGLAVDFLPLNVTSEAAVVALHAQVQERYGRLDVLVNNAGVYLDEGVSVFDVPMDQFRLTMDTNFYGPLYLCRAFVPLMRRTGYGRVVNVSSGYGSMAEMSGRVAAYRISKVALNALTRIVAAEARGSDIKVNAACPGWVRTDMGGRGAPRSVEQGAETIVWLATLPADGPTGGFFRDKRLIPW